MMLARRVLLVVPANDTVTVPLSVPSTVSFWNMSTRRVPVSTPHAPVPSSNPPMRVHPDGMVGAVLAVLLRPVTTQNNLLVAEEMPVGYDGEHDVVPLDPVPIAPNVGCASCSLCPAPIGTSTYPPVPFFWYLSLYAAAPLSFVVSSCRRSNFAVPTGVVIFVFSATAQPCADSLPSSSPKRNALCVTVAVGPPAAYGTETAQMEFAMPEPVADDVIVVVPLTPGFVPTAPYVLLKTPSSATSVCPLTPMSQAVAPYPENTATHKSSTLVENALVVVDPKSCPYALARTGLDVSTSLRNTMKICAPFSGAAAQLHANDCVPAGGLARW
jgi:hypothetical protein